MSDIEKAIKFFRNLINGVPKSNLLFGKPKDYENQMQLLAIQALVEKQEREKGCEYCKDDYGPCLIEQDEITISYYERDKCFYDNGEVLNWSYCPICGRKLREENNDNP